MKNLSALSMLAMVVAFSAAAQEATSNFTVTNTDRAKALIDDAIEAHGGDALTKDLRTLRIDSETITYSVDQSRGTTAPWDRATNRGFSAIDLENEIFVTRNEGDGGGFEFHNGAIIGGDSSAQIDYRAKTVTPLGEPDYDTRSGPFKRVTPALLLRTLQDRADNAYYLGEVETDGVTYDLIGFSMTVGPAITLYFEKDTHLLRRSERVFAGFGLVEYRFDEYKNRSGIPFNKRFTLLLNGDTNLLRENLSVTMNASVDEMLALPEDFAVLDELDPDPYSQQEVASGVWHLGGNGTYSMVVDMGDHLVMVGGTGGVANALENLPDALQEKPLKYGVLTHHHSDHVMGVAAYESAGATVIASSAHETIARGAASDGEALSFTPVDNRMVLEGAGRTLELIDLGPTAHTEHLVVAYLPAEGVLFEADHFAMPRVGDVAPAVSSTRTFAAALRESGLEPKIFLSAHSPRAGTPADLKRAVEAAEADSD